jgi:hypothetical protein
MTYQLDDKKIDASLARLRSPIQMAAFTAAKMPLGFAAGLRVDAVDRASCRVSLPGGWRTQNPFGSTYWAAQGMAAELATGLHPFVFTNAAPVPVRMILAACEGSFSRQCKGRGTFTFDQAGQLEAAVNETLRTGEQVLCPVLAIGHDPEGAEVSKWTFTWSFRARLPS